MALSGHPYHKSAILICDWKHSICSLWCAPTHLKSCEFLPISGIAADLPRTLMSAFDDSEICRSILENLPTGLCVIDIHMRVLFWSSGAERITGRLRHDVVGRCCTNLALLHCGRSDGEVCKPECPLAGTIKSAQLIDRIMFLQHKSGHEVPVRARAVPVRNVHGSIIGAVEIFEDLASFNLDDRNAVDASGAMEEITGVTSRVAMQFHLRESLRSFLQMHFPFAVLCFRIEGLDRFRASFGLEAATSLLRALAHTLKSALWQTDFLGRWSHDQFLVILNGCREDALPSVRERLTTMVRNDCIEWWGERRSLPISVGQATPQTEDSVASLIERAHNSLPAAIEMARAATPHQGSQ